MKKITLLLFAVLLSASGFSQFTINEDFNSGAPAGWGTAVWEGTCDFQFGTDLPTGDDFLTQAWFYDDDACGDIPDVNFLSIISASYNLSGATTAVLTVDVAFQESGDQYFDIEVWEGSTTQLAVIAHFEDDMDPDIQTLSYDVSAYVNSSLTFRFTFMDDPEFDGTGSWGWHGGIDNFRLETDALGVADNQVEGFSMYPNPAKNSLNISAANTIDQIAIYDVLGRKVIDQSINLNNVEVNVSELTAGAYFIQVSSGTQKGSYKFIKQ
ncbi:T9SS type A sorting domain-containing protein [Aureisphaera sp. CAU 1614]|uniref:T9SS type A sorting domain-containing protein n=1 Tax=Halomarinibacterium sedimenti TaxID=2857106 RepID=A0A9X1JWM9_9FLAO|nr:T9SS type A sorting domain-containing protein [Halomarinibacterium sedimenti]MBW2937188.1 T9SS type A sorting domain-containing protein [Halomarinibacterium sedimenti]